MDPVEVLSFIFLLSSLELGQDYSTTSFDETQTQVIKDLSDFGIIYQPPSSSSRFYPTRLATTLTSDAGALANSITSSPSIIGQAPTQGIAPATSTAEKGFIIIETNYRLYAYTSSPLQIAVLSLFTTLLSKYPNLVAGKLTRESIRAAVKLGITSDQIISYLAAHAHPQMRKRLADRQSSLTNASNPSDPNASSVLPPTVLDQIRLWQIEGERMKATEGFLFKDFDSRAEYEGPCKYAETIDVLVWKNDRKRMFFVWKHTEVVSFIQGKQAQRQRQDQGGGT